MFPVLCSKPQQMTDLAIQRKLHVFDFLSFFLFFFFFWGGDRLSALCVVFFAPNSHAVSHSAFHVTA